MKKHLKKSQIILITASVTALLAVTVMAVLVTIVEHKQEAKQPFFNVVEVTDETEDPAIWGKNFPFQYDGYKRTVDQIRTKYGGSEALPRKATIADPREVVSQSRLAEDPRLIRMWAGYAFSKDFREERGHAYMLDDQTFTERQNVTQQPGTCLHCHASIYLPYKKLGDGDLMLGFEKMNQMHYQDARKLVNHPITCLDCHEPQTMQLRITRPAFLEGIKALKSHEGIKDYNVNRDASHQEMRTFVCAQCHVEYYFKGKEKRLVYPWSNGIKVNEILEYYDKEGHKDWVHAETGAPVLKAQHPEFETWRQGIHARSGVSCADCHMPYTRQGAHKISDHHVRSPLLNVQRACMSCHPWGEKEMKARVEAIQDNVYSVRSTAMDALLQLIDDLKAAKSKKINDQKIKNAQNMQRRAQFLLDFVEAENSIGFHAPQAALKTLAESIDASRKGQMELR